MNLCWFIWIKYIFVGLHYVLSLCSHRIQVIRIQPILHIKYSQVLYKYNFKTVSAVWICRHALCMFKYQPRWTELQIINNMVIKNKKGLSPDVDIEYSTSLWVWGKMSREMTAEESWFILEGPWETASDHKKTTINLWRAEGVNPMPMTQQSQILRLHNLLPKRVSGLQQCFTECVCQCVMSYA